MEKDSRSSSPDGTGWKNSQRIDNEDQDPDDRENFTEEDEFLRSIYEDIRNYEVADDDDPHLNGNPDEEDEPYFDLFAGCGSPKPPPPRSAPSPTTQTLYRTFPPIPCKMPNESVPRPGPARLGPRASLPEWLEEAKQCHYLPEAAMKQLCEMVKECLMEGRLPLKAVVLRSALIT